MDRRRWIDNECNKWTINAEIHKIIANMTRPGPTQRGPYKIL